MDAYRAAELEARFEEEHEAEARRGWPGSWADRPVFREFFDAWPKELRDEFLATGNEAFQQLLQTTAAQHQTYEQEAKSAETQPEKTAAWLRFLENTSGQRRIFRTTVFSKLVELENS